MINIFQIYTKKFYVVKPIISEEKKMLGLILKDDCGYMAY